MRKSEMILDKLYSVQLYDYYDDTYTYVPELSWMTNTNLKADTNTLNALQDLIETGNINVSREEIEKAVKKAVRNVNSQVVAYKAIKETEIMEKEFAKTTTAKIKRNQ